MVTASHIMLTLEYAEGAGESHIAAGQLRAKRRRKRRRVGGRSGRDGGETEREMKGIGTLVIQRDCSVSVCHHSL